MRVLVFAINAVAQLALAAAGLLLLLLALNGYSGAQASPSLIFYLIFSLGSAVGLGAASASAARRLSERRSYSALGASAIAVPVFALLGILILFGLFFAAIVLAEVTRGMR
jgi:hypothetical protein